MIMMTVTTIVTPMISKTVNVIIVTMGITVVVAIMETMIMMISLVTLVDDFASQHESGVATADISVQPVLLYTSLLDYFLLIIPDAEQRLKGGKPPVNQAYPRHLVLHEPMMGKW